jgi:hypothetical protein
VSVELTTSTELLGLLDRLHRLAEPAGRPELVDRLARVRARLTSRPIRVGVLGGSGRGVSSLVEALAAMAPGRLPGVTFAEVAGPVAGWALDAVLVVGAADQPYGAAEVSRFDQVRAAGLPVAGVLTKIDAYPEWARTQKVNREVLTAAGLDSPAIPLLPVSATLAQAGRQRADEALRVASGLPQLLDFLAERMPVRIDAGLRDAVLDQAYAVADELGTGWTRELGTLGADVGDRAGRLRRAVAELERCQQLSASWQLALADGMTELMAQVEHDLRDRLRAVVRVAEEDLGRADPLPRWSVFDTWLRGALNEAVRTNWQLARERSRELAEQVATRLDGQPRSAVRAVPVPEPRLAVPEQALRQVNPIPPPGSGASGLSRLVNSVRGSYGGVLMVGVVTSLAGMVLINPWSIGAGVLLGLFTFLEERKAGRERRVAEAKTAVAKLMDEAIFQVGDVSRGQLRQAHRDLRDHFTRINDGRLRAASDAVQAAANPEPGRDDARAGELRAQLAELAALLPRAARPAPAVNGTRPNPVPPQRVQPPSARRAEATV